MDTNLHKKQLPVGIKAIGIIMVFDVVFTYISIISAIFRLTSLADPQLIETYRNAKLFGIPATIFLLIFNTAKFSAAFGFSRMKIWALYTSVIICTISIASSLYTNASLIGPETLLDLVYVIVGMYYYKKLA